MKKIIIFGATGNVGSYVTKYASNYFDNKQYEIIATGRKETKVFDRLGIKYISVDINNAEEFNKLPKDNIHAIIFLAAVIPSYMDNYDARSYLNTNIMGFYNVLEYCKENRVDRVIYSTTVFDISLYTKEENIELFPDMPRNFSYKGDHAVYVISKNTALELIEHYHQEYGIKKFIFRFPTIYNYSSYHYYYPNGQKTLRPLYKMIEQAKAGLDIELWGDPNYSKDMVYVEDCAQMLCKAVEVNRESGFYNVGTGKPVTLKQQIEAIIEVFSPKDKPSKIVYRPDKKAGGGFIMNVNNAIEELGYKPMFGVKELFEEYKKEMEKDTFDDIRRK